MRSLVKRPPIRQPHRSHRRERRQKAIWRKKSVQIIIVVDFVAVKHLRFTSDVKFVFTQLRYIDFYFNFGFVQYFH